MLRSRMFTPLFRLYAGWAIAALVFAFLFGITTTSTPFSFGSQFPYIHSDDPLNTVAGPLTLGWKGPVGVHLGYVISVAIAAAAGFLAALLVAFRDADPQAEAEAVHVESVPMTRAPSGVSYWPIAAAVGLAMVAIGWVANFTLLMAGAGVLIVCTVVWTFRTWADRATGDEEVNREIYHRVVDPLRIPLLAVLGIALVVFGISRVLLAVNRTAAIAVFVGAVVVFVAVFALVAFGPKLSKGLSTALFLLLAAAILIAGVAAAIRGERQFGNDEPSGTGAGSTKRVSLSIPDPLPDESR